MKVTTNLKSVTIVTCANESTYPKNSLSYQKVNDMISLFSYNVSVATEPISSIVVNAVQLTNENAENLLDSLFSKGCCCGDTSDDTCPYTKAEYSDPLVFPTPIRTGHIVDFFKGDVLSRSYEWNGWFWDLKSAKPNLIITYYEPENYTTTYPLEQNEAILFAREIDNKGYFAVIEGKSYDQSKSITSFDKIDNSYIFGRASYILNDKIEHNIENANIKRLYFRIASEDSSEASFPYRISLKNMHLNSIDMNINQSIDSITIDQVTPTPESDPNNFMISGNNVVVKDSLFSSGGYIVLSKSSGGDTNATLSLVNNVLNSSLLIQKYDDTYTLNISMTILNNKGLESISLSGVNYYIEHLEIDLDEQSLKTVDIRDCYLSETILDILVDALTLKTFTQSDRKIKISGDTVISDSQKTRLENAGWVLKN